MTSQIPEKYLEAQNGIMKLISDPSEEDLFTLWTIPFTVGALVSRGLSRYINNIIFNKDIHLKIALFKIGELNPLSSDYVSEGEYVVRDFLFCTP
jgi:hypothetical protein